MTLFPKRLLAPVLVLAALPAGPALAKVSANHAVGSAILGYDNTCSASYAGSLRYNSGDLGLEYCNGTGWVGLVTTSIGSGVIGGGASGVTLKLVNGSAAAPALTFYNDTNTGLYYVASNTINWSTNGVQHAVFNYNNLGYINITGAYEIGGNPIVRVPSADTANSIAFGWYTLNSGSLSGTSNTAYGYSALSAVTSGSNNVGVGTSAGNNITTGSQNVAVGYQSMYGGPITGSNNTAFGYQAMYTATGAVSNNSAAGAYALYSVGSAVGNTAAGSSALFSNTANYNTAGGTNAGKYVTSATGVTAIGYGALQGLVSAPMTGADLTAVGDSAATNAQGAVSDVTTIGSAALASLTTGNKNTAVGSHALTSVTTGVNNTGLGYYAGASLTGNYNTAIGDSAMYYAAATDNNTAVGTSALKGISGTPLTGGGNTAVGDSALTTAQGAAANNTAVGYQALSGLTTGTGNVAVGYQAGKAGTAITTGTNNTFIGYQAQANANNLTNATAFGNGAIVTGSNIIQLGNGSITKAACNTQTVTNPSDRRLKKDITDLPPALGLDFILSLRPVSYRFNDGDETLRYGFIAQDIESALPKKLQDKIEDAESEHGLALVSRKNNDERTYGVNYTELLSPIVLSIQDMQKLQADVEQDLATEENKTAALTKILAEQLAARKILQEKNVALHKDLASLQKSSTR